LSADFTEPAERKNRLSAEHTETTERKIPYIPPKSALKQKNLITMKSLILKIIGTIVALVIIGAATVLTSCNVTRTITTTSSSIQRGDTTVIIQNKTIEQYDASKKF
jgi:hypothetical protein